MQKLYQDSRRETTRNDRKEKEEGEISRAVRLCMCEGGREGVTCKFYVGAKDSLGLARQQRKHVAGDLVGPLGSTGTMKADKVNVRDSTGTG